MISMSDVEVKKEKSEDGRIYEVGYLLVPSITEENLPVTYGNLKELVSSFGGEVISDEMPKMIPLAYTISKVISNTRNKFNTAYFGWIKFEMDTEKVVLMKKKLDLDQNIIRFILLKTVRENTIATKKFMRSDVHKRAKTEKGENGEDATPINKEEIDKEIDAMIA